MKEKKKIKEAQVYISEPNEIPEIKPQLDKDDKLFVMKGVSDITEGGNEEDDVMIVKFISNKKDEAPFTINDTKWEYCWAEYPDGKKDIGVYRFGHDLVYGYPWFKSKILDQQNQQLGENEEMGDDQTGVEGRDMDKLKQDVEKLFQKLDLSVIQQRMEKINTPIEQYEVIAKFAEMIGVPRNKLNKIIMQLKDVAKTGQMTENTNPKISKGRLIEMISNKTKNKNNG